MPKKYIKKVEVLNVKAFKRLGLDPAMMRKQVRSYTDQLISGLKPARLRSDLRDLVDEAILEYVGACNELERGDKFGAYNLFKSLTNLKDTSSVVGRSRKLELDGELIEFMREREEASKKSRSKEVTNSSIDKGIKSKSKVK